jgi:hypothetical protein
MAAAAIQVVEAKAVKAEAAPIVAAAPHAVKTKVIAVQKRLAVKKLVAKARQRPAAQTNVIAKKGLAGCWAPVPHLYFCWARVPNIPFHNQQPSITETIGFPYAKKIMVLDTCLHTSNETSF